MQIDLILPCLNVPDRKILSDATVSAKTFPDTVELQWLEHFSDLEYIFETGVVPANEY